MSSFDTESSFANSIKESSEKGKEKVNNRLSLDLNLSVEEQFGENNVSEEYKIKSDNNNSDGWRKKLQLSKEQTSLLEERFKHNRILNKQQKIDLASELNLTPRQVVVWFQNRRARTKLKLTEKDCESWKKRCEELAEENKKLKEEIENLQGSESTTLNADDSSVCPTCRQGWSMTGNDVGAQV